jgi:NTE family protein
MEDIPLYVGKRKNILVISGGGLKGLSALGALKYLFEQEIIIKPDILCGTSVGSIICFLLNIGYNPVDIYNVLEQIDFSELFQYDIDDLLDNVCFGFNTTDNIIVVMNSFLKKKKFNKNTTFKQLFEQTKSKLIITGTCINDSSLHFFSVDTYPDMEILKAIKISISIPIFCKPCVYDEKVWIDGGCINNYPIDLFKDKLNDVVGILLDDDYKFIKNFDGVDSYIFAVLKSIMRGLTINKYDAFKDNTIKIVCEFDQTTWEINSLIKKKLFNDGYETAKKFYSI